jgi:hypothetical protein
MRWCATSHGHTEKYPKGQVERLAVSRDLLGAYTVTIWIKNEPTLFKFENQWDVVESNIRRLLHEQDCRPFKVDSP